MPPIFGIYSIDQEELSTSLIDQIVNQVKYHVPRKVKTISCKGAWLSVATVENKVRTELESNFHSSGNLVIVADATLYKREELMRKLKIDFTNQNISNTHLILESYLTWGESCVKQLYGDFAFVIINTAKNELICGRDALGIKPLFYAEIDSAFVFGSELRYVKGSYKNKLETNDIYRYETLITKTTKKEYTLLRNVYRLPPGSYLTIKNGKIAISDYWELKTNRQINLNNEKDYIEFFREKLVESVNMRCAGASRIGAELSGGLDSSAVVGIATGYTETYKTPIIAFSNVLPVGVEYIYDDEKRFMMAMKELKNMKWAIVDHLSTSIIKLLQEAIEIQGCYLQQNFSILNNEIYKIAGINKIDILLSGFGGDEMVSNRTSVPWNELIQSGRWKVLFDELFYKGLKLHSIMKFFLILTRYIIKVIHKPNFKTGVFTADLLDRRFANLPLNPYFAQDKNLRQIFSEVFTLPTHPKLAERQKERLMADYLPQRLEYCYAATAQYGFEYRYPLLDVDLIETYLAFPPWLKYHHGVNRYVFREAIKGFVPEEIRNRNDKSGTTIPHVYQSLINERESIFTLIDEASLNPELNRIFDFSKFKPWYEALVARDEKEMNTLMPGAFYQYLMMLLYYK